MSISKQAVSTCQKIAKYLKYQRQKRNWTLADLSNRSGLTVSFLLRIEQEEYQTVKFNVIEKLAAALDMSLYDFLVKCELLVDQKKANLPAIEYFLKEKYYLPNEAIQDTKLFLDFLTKKYQTEIQYMKERHRRYWQKTKT